MSFWLIGGLMATNIKASEPFVNTSPLEECQYNNDSDISLLIWEYLNNREHHQQHGDDLLHLAALQSDPIFLKKLLLYTKNINMQNAEGETPLHVAVVYGNVAHVTALLQNNANISIQNNKKQTPYDVALSLTSHCQAHHAISDLFELRFLRVATTLQISLIQFLAKPRT
jgi:ankyrin repeat protein